MPKNNVTLDELRNVSRILNQNSVPVGRIRTEEEAAQYTAGDLTGHEWQVGDSFHTVFIDDETIEMPIDV